MCPRHYSDPNASPVTDRRVSTIKADPTAQARLLDLQSVDTRLSQLQHRRTSLPEHAQIVTLTAEARALSQDLIAAQTAVSDLDLEQSKAESDLQPVRDRLARNQQRIADGTVADPKALSGLVEEVEHLKRRISTLEDIELDVMQRLEDAGTAQATLTQRSARLGEQLAEVTATRDQQVAAIDSDARETTAERARVADGVPADLLTSYDKIRAGHGGVGAAALTQRRCTGCQLQLNPTDLQRYAAAAADEVLRCEECSRILIRTADSGI